MKKLGTFAVAALLIAVNSGCLATYAGGLGPTERSHPGWGAKSDIGVYGNTVELKVSGGKGNRKAEKHEALIRDFIEAGLISKGAEVVKVGGQIKMFVSVIDIETSVIVTIRLTEEGRVPTIVTEECGIPRYPARARNISADAYFLNAFKYAAGKAIEFL